MALVDLFSCNGGFSLGAHRAGLKVGAAYDLDTILSSSYTRNFPGTQLFNEDIAELSGQQIKRQVGERIVGIFGGPPCQGFSSIGRRDASDPRRLLVSHFFRIVSELQPAFFVMENVRGLAYPKAKPVLDHALSLVDANYRILGPIILDAADFGAATKRSRLFVIGVHRNEGEPLTEGELDIHRRPPATVFEAINDLSTAKPIGLDSLGFDHWLLEQPEHLAPYMKTMRSDTRMTTGQRAVTHRPDVAERFSKVAPGSVERIGRHHRLAWSGQCPTLRAGTGADRGSYQSVRPLHPDLPRVISVREAARLQGFHDAHVFHPTIWHSFRMIGNSVSPIIAQALFSALKQKVDIPKALNLAA